MKRLLFSMAILTLWQNVLAYDFKVGNLYYNVISSNDLTVEVTSQYDTWHTGTLFYYSGYRNGSGYTGHANFRSGYYDYYDLISDASYSPINPRGNRFSNTALTIEIPCTDPYGEISIPETISYLGITFNVIRIGQHAFYGCRYLSKVTIPSSISIIEDSAFFGCNTLVSVSTQNVSTIGCAAFGDCASLTNVRLNGSVVSIGDMAFNGCSLLTTLHLDNTMVPPSLGSSTLSSIPTYSSIYVPCANIGNYQSDNFWGRFSHYYGVGAAGELNLSVNDTLRGRIETIDTADCYTPATIRALSNYGYHFASWNDGITDNPRTITIEYDTTFTAIFDKNEYHVVGSSTDVLMGSVVGSGSALFLDTVTLIPVANYGYRFSHWDDGITDNPRRIIVNRDSSFTAYFDSALFALQTHSNNEEMGYARINSNDYLASSVNSFKYLSTQTIYATPTNGNQFMQWSDGVRNNPRVVTIMSDTLFVAVFAPKYILSIQSANDTMGIVTGGGLFNNQDHAVITAQANYGYHFTNWNDGMTTATRTIIVASDTLFIAYFTRNQYNVTAISANQAWGSVTGSTSALYGDSVTLTATATGQHHFAYWTDGTNQYTDNPLHVRVTQNNYYTAYFELNQYQVSVFSDGGGNGYVGLDGNASNGNYDYMSQAIIRAVPNPGYRFSSWSDGITYNPRTFIITNDTSFIAIFSADIYTISVNSDNAVMGNVTGSGIYQADSIAEIAAVPNHGYKFDHWQDNDTNNPRTVTVTTNQTYTAFFVTYDTLRIHDTTCINFYVHDTTTVTDTVTLTEYITIHDTTYAYGYIHDTIMVVDTLTVTEYFPIHDTTYLNVYVHDTTTVTDTVTLTEYVTVHDTTYAYGYIHDTIMVVDTLTVTEYIPIHDTTYLNVYVHDTTTVTDTITLTEYIPIHDTTYINIHDTTYINVPYPVHDTTYITVTDTVTTTVIVHDTITNTIFDTITNTIYDTTVVNITDTLWLHDTVYLHDTIYIYDTIFVGVDEVESINAKIYTSHGKIVVEGTQGNTVWLYNINGQVLSTKQDDNSPLHFDIPASGTYLIKIGDHPARKVVMIR